MASKSDKLDEQNTGPIVAPVFILCEGKGDASFFHHLAERRSISGLQVGFPMQDVFGRSGFGRYLVSMRPRPGYDRLEHLVIVSDNDSGADKAFREVCAQLEHAGHDAPPRPGIAVGKSPRITTLMIPGPGEAGNLETLLLRSVRVDHCLTEFWECCRLEELPIGVASKIKLTTVIAACCRKNPSCSLAWVYTQPENPIDLSHPCFDDWEQTLRAIVQ